MDDLMWYVFGVLTGYAIIVAFAWLDKYKDD